MEPGQHPRDPWVPPNPLPGEADTLTRRSQGLQYLLSALVNLATFVLLTYLFLTGSAPGPWWWQALKVLIILGLAITAWWHAEKFLAARRKRAASS